MPLQSEILYVPQSYSCERDPRNIAAIDVPQNDSLHHNLTGMWKRFGLNEDFTNTLQGIGHWAKTFAHTKPAGVELAFDVDDGGAIKSYAEPKLFTQWVR